MGKAWAATSRAVAPIANGYMLDLKGADGSKSTPKRACMKAESKKPNSLFVGNFMYVAVQILWIAADGQM